MGFPAVLTLVVVVLMLVGLILELLAPDVIVFFRPGPAAARRRDFRQGCAGRFRQQRHADGGDSLHRCLCGPVLGTAGIFRRPGHGATPAAGGVPCEGHGAGLGDVGLSQQYPDRGHVHTDHPRLGSASHNVSPSKFLIPLSYASIFGGICTLIGTSTNLVVNGLLLQSAHRPLRMFELAWVGVPCAIAGILFLLLFGFRLLPDAAISRKIFGRAAGNTCWK